jgi:hypothetical protein
VEYVILRQLSMQLFSILALVLCSLSQYQCDDDVVDVEVDADGMMDSTGHPMPADGSDYDKPVPFDSHYNMPTELKARLTGIGAEPDEAALEWQRTHQKREIKVHNEVSQEEAIYLYFDPDRSQKNGDFIVRTCISYL